MTLEQAEARSFDLGKLSAAHVAASHPFALAKMTKIVVPRPGQQEDGDSEILQGEPQPFDLWAHQRELLSMAMRWRRVIVLKARQLGITWAMALYALWFAMSHAAVEVVLVSIGKREAVKVGKRIRWLYDHLPSAVRQAFPIGKTDTLETFSVGHHDGESTIASLPSSSTAGRGETVNLLILDEEAHWEDADQRLASLLPTVADIGQLVIASTANGVGDSFHKAYIAAPENGYHKLFIRADERPDRDEEWVMAERGRVPEGLGVQEYPMTESEAFLSSGRCAFYTRALQEYLDYRVQPAKRRGRLEVAGQRVYFTPDDKGAWRVWRWREPDRQYLITADVCGGGGGSDFSVAGVWDLESWDLLATYRGRPEPTQFATELIRAGWLWRGDSGSPALMAPEVNDHGRAVLTVLSERGYPNTWVMPRFDQKRNIEVQQKGWLTTSASRPIMLAAAKEAVRDGSLGIADADIIGEMLVFETNPSTGKEEAREGHNDDRVMMTAIAAAVLIREASGGKPRRTTLADMAPYRRPASSRTGY